MDHQQQDKAFSIISEYILTKAMLFACLFCVLIICNPSAMAMTTTSNDLFEVTTFGPMAKHQKVDGGIGNDTVKIQMTLEQYNSDEFLADMIRFNYYLFNHYNPKGSLAQGQGFQFTTFDLDVVNIEILQFEIYE